MRFTTYERYDHWPFEGTNYTLQMDYRDITIGLEVRMMDWLEDNMISHAWSINDCITFKKEQDRLLFILKFQ